MTIEEAIGIVQHHLDMDDLYITSDVYEALHVIILEAKKTFVQQPIIDAYAKLEYDIIKINEQVNSNHSKINKGPRKQGY